MMNMETTVAKEWISAEEFAHILGSAPQQIRDRIKLQLIPGGMFMPSMTGNRPIYKVHYTTFLASLPGHKETTNEV